MTVHVLHESLGPPLAYAIMPTPDYPQVDEEEEVDGSGCDTINVIESGAAIPLSSPWGVFRQLGRGEGAGVNPLIIVCGAGKRERANAGMGWGIGYEHLLPRLFGFELLM